MGLTIEEIRKNKPEGATHYIKYNNSILYVKGQYMWINGVWEIAVFDIMEAKPL